MRYNLLFFILFFLTIEVVIAQPKIKNQAKHEHQHFNVESFNKQQADYIIITAGLTPVEASKFIPLMNELQNKRFELNREVRKLNRKLKENVNANDLDYQHLIELSLESSLKEAQLNKEYYQKFKLILSPKKIYKCRVAESDFMKNFVNAQHQKRKDKK